MNPQKISGTFNGPTTYRIVVEGSIGEPLSNNLDQMKVSEEVSDQRTISTLTGNVQDEAALNGILNTLYDYRCKLISVTRIS